LLDIPENGNKSPTILSDRRVFMKTIELTEEAKVSGRVDKASLADRYLVGLRTLENWQASGIISGILEKNRWTFDAQDCDDRLFRHTRTTKPTGACQPIISASGPAGRGADQAERKDSNGNNSN
jgi:hypothetical protein